MLVKTSNEELKNIVLLLRDLLELKLKEYNSMI